MATKRIEVKAPESFVALGIITQEIGDQCIRAHAMNGANRLKWLMGENPEKVEYITKMDLHRVYAYEQGWEFVDPSTLIVPPDLLTLVPSAVAREFTVLPVRIEDDVLVIATYAPDDLTRRSRLQGAVPNYSIRLVYAPRVHLLEKVQEAYSAVTEAGRLARDQESQDIRQALSSQGGDLGIAADDSGAVAKIVSLILEQAVSMRASDVHLDPAEHYLQVRYRVDAVLRDVTRYPENVSRSIIQRIKLLAEMDIAERRRAQDGRITVRVNDRPVDIRVVTTPTVYGEKVVMRILSSELASLPLAKLDFAPDTLAEFERSCRKPHGLVLVTGPTGSGKSTTLYSALNQVASREINILTVEDPVEFRFPGINQVQTDEETGVTFASALRSFLRSDPDVILLGEIRDEETARVAIQASLTGHMLLSTLHTNSAPLAVTRLMDMGVEPYLISASLEAVLAQRLARRLCERCKVPYRLAGPELAPVSEYLVGTATEFEVYDASPDGCEYCAYSGYRGRIAIHELMVKNGEMERLINERSPIEELVQMARKSGMRTLREDGWAKVLDGKTSLSEIVRVTSE